jgi:amino acid transporter
VLLLVVSAARSAYGMGGAGVLPTSLGRIGNRATPTTATIVVLVVGAAFVLAGQLACNSGNRHRSPSRVYSASVVHIVSEMS